MTVFARVVKGSDMIKMWKCGQGALLERKKQEKNITGGALDFL